MHTIGVSAALGAAGVVLWGDLSISSSEVIIACPASSLALSLCWGPRVGKRPCQSHRAGVLIHPSLLRRSAGVFMTTWWIPWVLM